MRTMGRDGVRRGAPRSGARIYGAARAGDNRGAARRLPRARARGYREQTPQRTARDGVSSEERGAIRADRSCHRCAEGSRSCSRYPFRRAIRVMSSTSPHAEHLVKLMAADGPVVSGRRERLRFTDFTFHRSADGRCNAEVELEWLDGVRVRGGASGQSSQTVDLRVAADAALRALERFSDEVLAFEL